MAHRGRLNVLANILAQALPGDFRRVRGQLPARLDRRRRRRQVPPRLLQRSRQRARPADPSVADAQPQPPGGGRPGRRGPHARQADRYSATPSAISGIPAADPRRRRLRRPGAGGRDAQPVAAGRLHDRRHHPRRRQQPDRLHHLAQRRPLDDLLHRRGQDDPGADLPRQRRRSRGGRLRRRAGPRFPPDLQQRRGHRHVLLPPARATTRRTSRRSPSR